MELYSLVLISFFHICGEANLVWSTSTITAYPFFNAKKCNKNGTNAIPIAIGSLSLKPNVSTHLSKVQSGIRWPTLHTILWILKSAKWWVRSKLTIGNLKPKMASEKMVLRIFQEISQKKYYVRDSLIVWVHLNLPVLRISSTGKEFIHLLHRLKFLVLFFKKKKMGKGFIKLYCNRYLLAFYARAKKAWNMYHILKFNN